MERTISPQALVRYRDNWYMDTYCHLRNGLRTSNVSRITKAAFAKGAFVRVEPGVLQSHYGEAYGIFNGLAPHHRGYRLYRHRGP